MSSHLPSQPPAAVYFAEVRNGVGRDQQRAAVSLRSNGLIRQTSRGRIHFWSWIRGRLNESIYLAVRQQTIRPQRNIKTKHAGKTGGSNHGEGSRLQGSRGRYLFIWLLGLRQAHPSLLVCGSYHTTMPSSAEELSHDRSIGRLCPFPRECCRGGGRALDPPPPLRAEK